MRRVIAGAGMLAILSLACTDGGGDDEAQPVAVDCVGGPVGEPPAPVEDVASSDLRSCRGGFGAFGYVVALEDGALALCPRPAAQVPDCPSDRLLVRGTASDLRRYVDADIAVAVRGSTSELGTIEVRSVTECDTVVCPATG